MRWSLCPSETHRLVAYVDPSLEQQVFDVPQAQREADVHQYNQANDLGRGIEIAERARVLSGAGHGAPYPATLNLPAMQLV